MKVSEATSKVCPFIYNNQSSALGESDGYHINCITSECMAWEFTKVDDRKYFNENATDEDKIGYEKKSEWTERFAEDIFWTKELSQDEKQGYCQRLNND